MFIVKFTRYHSKRVTYDDPIFILKLFYHKPIFGGVPSFKGLGKGKTYPNYQLVKVRQTTVIPSARDDIETFFKCH